MYQRAVNQHQHLINLRDDEWTARVIQVAFAQHVWVQWTESNAADPRIDRITAIASAERPGGVFEQQPNFGDQMLGDGLRELLGEADADNIGQQVVGDNYQHHKLLGQQASGMPGGMGPRQAGPVFAHAGVLQPEDIRALMPGGIAGGRSALF
ncbi:hypothetical protein DOTSEDRAFT_72854 [Dothistroma septosporum NZE10]|uniref:Uncharacterized protein n=1 Tax=Dothistroma septosporum (strain NZE10 / CBS 128990) TaxID=675120 RepID=M2YPR9_DOTSN|nr:hypothetical protein DOTSEDRAFT_72854 [Dothistroma septosporum NZE10]